MQKKLLDKNTAATMESIFLLGNLAELHEWNNRQHLERIYRYVYLMTGAMGLAGEEVASLSLASVLHDVGKYFTPKELLLSGGNLNQKEWQTLEKHTLQGAEFLQDNDSYIIQIATKIVLTHHERWDGSGYPNKLKGDEIPLGGCICAVADVFDALTTRRPYKNGIVEDDNALKMIKESSGVLFNPEVVAAFDKVFQDIVKIKKACK